MAITEFRQLKSGLGVLLEHAVVILGIRQSQHLTLPHLIRIARIFFLIDETLHSPYNLIFIKTGKEMEREKLVKR